MPFHSAYENFGKHWQTGIFHVWGPDLLFIGSLSKSSIFWPQTYTSHLILSIQKPNYRTVLKASVTCQNLQRYKFTSFVRWRFLCYKKRNHQSQPTSLSVSDPVCFIQHLFSLSIVHVYYLLILYISWNSKRTRSAFDTGKHEDLSRKKQPARCFMSSLDVVTKPCCSLEVIFHSFIFYLIGHKAINIPEILSGAPVLREIVSLRKQPPLSSLVCSSGSQWEAAVFAGKERL